MKHLIYAITIYINYFFSPILALAGRSHDIDSGDNTWALTVGMSFVCSMVLSSRSLLTKRTIRYGKNLIIFPLLFFLLAFLVEYLLFPNTGIAIYASYPITKWFVLSTLYVWPAVFIAIDIATEDSLDQFYKWVDVLAILISLGMIPSLMTLALGAGLNMGGDNYQAISYMGAFAVGVLLYGVVSPYQDIRFKIFQHKIYKIISIVFILIDVAAVFISGGRGGALLLILNVIICIIAFSRNSKALVRKIAISSFAILLFIFLFGQFLSFYGLSDFFDIGLERTFSYISGGGIDLSETSNRDVVYKIAFQNISNHPLIGQGIFRTMSMYGGYPHNFILELLVDGGVIYLIFWIYFLMLFFKKLFRMIKKEPSKNYLLVFASLPLLSLMFSGTYTSNSYLWFVIAYVLTRDKTIKSRNKINLSKVL